MSPEVEKLKVYVEHLRAEWKRLGAITEQAAQTEDDAFWKYNKADEIYWKAFNEEVDTWIKKRTSIAE